MPGDSILAHQRSIDRPITLHAGQLRITGAYDVSLHARRFGATGETVSLRDAGSASIRNRYTLDLRYGITQFIQLTTALTATQHVIKYRSEYISAEEDDPAVSHSVQRDFSGVDDLFIGVDLRAPLKTRKLDLAIALGAFLPTASSEPAPPQRYWYQQGVLRRVA